MTDIHTILVPVQDPGTFVGSGRLMHQIAWLGRCFKAKVILLHVVTGFDYPAGRWEKGDEITARDLEASVVRRAETDLANMPLPVLAGIPVTRILLRGQPAEEILQTVLDMDVSLVAMRSPDDPAFLGFLAGSATAKVLLECTCPVWTGAHLEDAADRAFSVRHILCSLDLTPHDRHTVTAAAGIAAAMGAKLTLIHVTSSVEVWGPGGTHVDPVWKKTLVGIAVAEIAELQLELGTQAEVIIESGNVPELLNLAAERTQADVLIVGRIPGRSHLGDNGDGHAIIRESRVPVLSV
jgi:nucleotide-binding universal stress UspA family protein